jgi:beta-mannosidase
VIDKYFDWYYQTPKDFEAYLYVSQVQQAMGMGIAFEAHRRAMPHCMGTLYWQINDCYPVTSWASIDSYGNWKALHYKARQLYQTFMLSPFVEDKQLNIYVVSDKLTDQSASLNMKLYDFSGKLLKEETKDILVKANASGIYYSEAVKSFLKKYSKKDVVLRVKLESGKQSLAENDFFFVHSKDLHLKKGSIKMTSKKTEKGYEIRLQATTFSKDVQLSTDDGAGFFTNNFFNLIPGIPVTVELEIEKEGFQPEKDVKIYSLRDSYK